MSAWDQPPAPGAAATSHATPDPSFGAPPPDPSFGAPPAHDFGASAALATTGDRAAPPAAPARGRRNRWVAATLALIFGGVGAQRFYLGERGMGAAILGLLVLGCVVPPFLLVVLGWALVDAVRFAVMSDAAFDAKYNKG